LVDAGKLGFGEGLGKGIVDARGRYTYTLGYFSGCVGGFGVERDNVAVSTAEALTFHDGSFQRWGEKGGI
jgi:hypothetical protein